MDVETIGRVPWGDPYTASGSILHQELKSDHSHKSWLRLNSNERPASSRRVFKFVSHVNYFPIPYYSYLLVKKVRTGLFAMMNPGHLPWGIGIGEWEVALELLDVAVHSALEWKRTQVLDNPCNSFPNGRSTEATNLAMIWKFWLGMDGIHTFVILQRLVDADLEGD
ncbi:hypothetical protein FB45DRAFT_871045 [Roridomyces roridus]|uniref:Uncharacterized protein n=1 Tax=Roridomyces roridus TaxID=1738132 RepID=A0AAD7BI26_9AGAR|nr:hypothetical protein FB45DRAFT_871045 [Roridomyces roridus]